MNQAVHGNLQRRFDEYRTSVARLADVMAADCEAAAHALVDEFRARRIELQQSAEAERNANLPAGKKRIALYAPLSLFARFHHSNLQLYWQQVHRSAHGHAIYRYMPKGRRGTGYDLQALLSAARDFERDLVRETELRANDIRREWRQVIDIRQAARVVTVLWQAPSQTLGAAPDQETVL